MYGVSLMVEFKLKIQGSKCLYIVERFTPIFEIIIMVLITILLDPVLGLLAFVIWALVIVEAVMKLFKEILQWLRPIFICAKKIVSYSNGAEDGSSEIKKTSLLVRRQMNWRGKMNCPNCLFICNGNFLSKEN